MGEVVNSFTEYVKQKDLSLGNKIYGVVVVDATNKKKPIKLTLNVIVGNTFTIDELTKIHSFWREFVPVKYPGYEGAPLLVKGTITSSPMIEYGSIPAE